jgi:hypothetical protein
LLSSQIMFADQDLEKVGTELTLGPAHHPEQMSAVDN